MSKVSQRLGDVVKLLKEMTDVQGQGGGCSMKLVELEQADGDPCFVNPREGVAWLEKRGTTKTRVHFTGGSATVVMGTPQEIADLLED